MKESRNPYERDNTIQRIIEAIKKIDLNNIIKKRFFDIQIQEPVNPREAL